jgi:predicted Zn finger-like uncharacterized protein
MPIQMVCPTCGRAYNLADSLKGKRVRCSTCSQTFVAEAPKVEEAGEVVGYQLAGDPAAEQAEKQRAAGAGGDDWGKPPRALPRFRTRKSSSDNPARWKILLVMYLFCPLVLIGGVVCLYLAFNAQEWDRRIPKIIYFGIVFILMGIIGFLNGLRQLNR